MPFGRSQVADFLARRGTNAASRMTCRQLAPEKPMADRAFTDVPKIDTAHRFVRCPCGEVFDFSEYAVCPSCGSKVSADSPAIVGEPPPTCTDNSPSTAAARASSAPATSRGHQAHLEEVMAVREIETAIRSGKYAPADPETVHDHASFLVFAAALARDLNLPARKNISAAAFIAAAAKQAAEKKAPPTTEASWKNFARLLFAGITPEKPN